MKRSSIAVMALTVATALTAFAPSHAADCGVGGSPSNWAGSCERSDNQVVCSGTATPAGYISASTEGAETCNDGSSAAPTQGRVGVSHECDCVYADGDADNSSPLNDWIRIDSSGVHCSSGGQSYNQEAGGSCG